MSPVASETAKARGETTAHAAVGSTRRGRPRGPKSDRSSRGFVVGGVAIIIFLCAWAVLLNALTKNRGAPSAAPADASRRHVGTIMLAPEGEYCRQLGFDNRSGRTVEMGRVKCTEDALAADPKEAMRERYSGGRLESIRKSFSDR